MYFRVAGKNIQFPKQKINIFRFRFSFWTATSGLPEVEFHSTRSLSRINRLIDVTINFGGQSIESRHLETGCQGQKSSFIM